MEWSERIGRRVKLRDLHVLMAVVHCGSMAQAAKQLAVSQPVVSKTIISLEQTLGVRLLDRSPHGIEPTVYGNALVNSGMAAFEELKSGVKQIEFLSDAKTGEVRIGCGEIMAAGFLPAAIEHMRRAHPNVTHYILAAPTAATGEFRELRERQADLVLARIAEPFVEEDLKADILFADRLYVIAGKRNKLTKRRSIQLTELLGEPWLLPMPQTVPGSLVAEAFHSEGLPVPRTHIASMSLHLHNSLMPGGPYLSMVPGSVLRYGILDAGTKVLPVKFNSKPRPFGAIALKHRTLNPAAALFIQSARVVAARMNENR